MESDDAGMHVKLLLPVDPRHERPLIGTRLQVPHRGELWVSLDAVPVQRFTAGRGLWEASLDLDNHGGDLPSLLPSDAYGDSLEWGRAADFALVLQGWPEEGPTGDLIRATGAYLAALPPDYPVVPYWS